MKRKFWNKQKSTDHIVCVRNRECTSSTEGQKLNEKKKIEFRANALNLLQKVIPKTLFFLVDDKRNVLVLINSKLQQIR